MSISKFFIMLGAPLANPRWSWGAPRGSDGAIFLRVWQDRKLIESGRTLMLIDAYSKSGDDAKNLGCQERLRHIESIRAGAPCFLVMCSVVDVEAVPRRIKDFNEQEVFVAGKIVEMDGLVWIEMGGRRPVSTII
jgi:putative restriction endonuclease